MGKTDHTETEKALPRFVAKAVLKDPQVNTRVPADHQTAIDNRPVASSLTNTKSTSVDTYQSIKSISVQYKQIDHDQISKPIDNTRVQSKISPYQMELAERILDRSNRLSTTGLRINTWIGYGYDYLEDTLRFLLGRERKRDEKFPSAPIWIVFYSCYLYACLAIFACICDILRFFGLIMDYSHQEDSRQQHFVNLYTDFQAFFARNMYGYARDVWNRPISSAPDAKFSLVDRISHDFGWTFEIPGTSTETINLGSYNYLGFAQNTGPCVDLAAESIQKFGLGVCSSRNEFGNQMLHKEMENMVAEFLGVEDAICFPMGFATNAMNLPCFVSKGCLILSDQLNHASIILGCRLSGATIRTFKHNDVQDLEAKLLEAIIRGDDQTDGPFRKILICVEGIYSMEGTIVKLPEIIALKKRYKAYLYLDEAHSMGALGPNGRGVCDYFGCDPRDIDILMGTFSKSFASIGGYIAGRKEIINYLRVASHNACYGTSMSAPVAQQVISTLNILMGKDRTNNGLTRTKQLARNTIYFRRRLKQLGFIIYGDEYAPIIPLMIYDPLKLVTISRELLHRHVGVVVVGFPATPLLLARARFCMNATHTKEVLDQALKAIDDVGEKFGAKYLRRRYKPNEIIEY